MKRCAVVLMAAIAVVAMSGCEPSMTITARDADHSTTECYVMHVVGKVTPATATSKVVLQETIGGRWTDASGWADQGSSFTSSPTPRTANVSKTTGGYSITYYINWFGTKHLRVRSNGGSTASVGFYVTTDGEDGC